MRDKKGYTLIEVIIVVGLITVFFTALLGIMVNSRTYWDKGQNKIDEQQEARWAMDSIAKDLRQANTNWGITISGNEILFYKPDFNATGTMVGTHWVGYKINPSNATQLLKKEEGDADYSVVARYFRNIAYAGSTDGCLTFNNNTVPSSCPRVRVTITTFKDKNFTLTSDIVLRNQYTAAAGDPPEEGEF